MKDHPTLKGIAYMLFCVCVWAGWVVASRYSVTSSLSAADITAIRFSVAGILLLPVALKRGLSAGPWGWKGGLLLAFCIGAPYTQLAVGGMAYAPASHATIIQGTLLLLTTIVGIHGLKEETSRMRLLGIAFSLGGIVCMLFAKGTASSSGQWLGHLFFIASGAMWGVSVLLVRAWNVEPLQSAVVVCVFSLLLYLPVYMLFMPHHIGLYNWHEVAFQGIYQGLINSIIAFIAFNRGIHLLGASRAGAMTPLVPVLSTLLAIPILHETPSALEWTGVAAVSSGVLLASGIIGRHVRPLPQVAAEDDTKAA